jgi:glycerol-3-phosphate acyltransferase PlsX
MRIAIDAMGGDRAPAAPVAGAVQALEAYDDVSLVLVGDPARLETELAARGAAPGARLALHDAPEVVGCDDPVKSVRGSAKVSARACADLLRAKDVDAVLTMGNTGAAVAAATLYCRRLAGVRRTGIAVPFPRQGGVSLLVDCGANPDAKPQHLYQYALMGAEYVRAAFGVEAPRIGILSIGEEETKGNRLVFETHDVFRADPVPGFVGNVEPHSLFEDVADVVVCDGFTGNVALKAVEGMAGFILAGLPGVLSASGNDEPESVMRASTERVDYAAYGGALLLGVDGAYVIGHGRSDARAFVNGVRVIRSYVQGDVGAHIVEQLAAHGVAQAAGSSEEATT